MFYFLQVEIPDEWLRFGNVWEHARPEYSMPVHLYGRTICDASGYNYTWIDTKVVYAVAYDMPVPGYGKNSTTNTMRLWSVKSPKDFDLAYCKMFSMGACPFYIQDIHHIEWVMHFTLLVF